MHFPKYWALGSSGDFSAWHWSDTSPEDARAKANASAERLKQRLLSSNVRNNRYGYADRMLREPVIEEVSAQHPEENGRAIITRNSYGALVLNTDKICFVDIDLPKQRAPQRLKALVASFFGKSAANPPATPAEDPLARVQHWFKCNGAWSGRLYETGGGFRILITSHFLDPVSSETEQLFGQLGADPLYCRLCKNQASFRARLTPKPWRCRLRNPPAKWPFLSSKAEERFAAWQSRYESTQREFVTCKYLQTLGSEQVLAGIETVVSRHDDATGALTTGKPLA